MMRSSSHVSSIVHPLQLAVVSVLALAIGCKGCDGPAGAPAAVGEPQPEPDSASLERLNERLAALKLDLSKPYPKRPDGVVECGEDKTCFLARLERCEPALFAYNVQEQAGLLVKHVEARYRVEGRKDDHCAVQRLVTQADVELPEADRKSLSDKGKGQLEIDMMLAEAAALLHSYMAPRVTCLFPMTRALELGLDVVENKAFDRHFQESCEVVSGNEGWPSDLTAPAAGQAPPAADVPAAAKVPPAPEAPPAAK